MPDNRLPSPVIWSLMTTLGLCDRINRVTPTNSKREVPAPIKESRLLN
jgi:hypothetical protein